MKSFLLVLILLSMAQFSFAAGIEPDFQILRTTSTAKTGVVPPVSMEPVQIQVLRTPLGRISGPYRPWLLGCGCYGYPVTYVDGVPHYKGFLLPLIYSAFSEAYLPPFGISAQYENEAQSIALR